MPTMVGRTAVRGLEAQLSAEISKFFFDKLITNIKSGDTKVANTEKWDPSTWPKQAKGVGFYEAPRGALSHWCVIENGKIANYQAIVPTTWNACPRDDAAGHGAYELARRSRGTPRLANRLLKRVRDFAQIKYDGVITEEEASVHPEKNVITRALGVEQTVLPSFTGLPLPAGAVLLLCTDGLTNMVSEARIAEILRDTDFYDAPSELVSDALLAGGNDNITVLLMQPMEGK